MAVKKRTLGDDLRDFKAGKAPDGYRNNIKNTTPYAIKSWQHSDGFVGGEDASYNPLYGEVTTSSTNNKTKGVNSFLNSGNQMINSVQNDFQYNVYREYENKYKNYNYEQLKTSYKSAKDDREKNWILNKIKKDSSSEELKNWYDTLSQEYDSKLQQSPDPKISKEFEEIASEYEELIKDKQHQETAQKNQKKNELYSDYYKDYDYNQLKEESENSRLSDYERSWLENAAYEKASSADLQTSYDNNEITMKEIREQKESVLEKQNKASSNEEKQSYIREASNLDEEYDSLYSKNETLKNQIEKKKYDEKKKAEYDDVIENNIKAKTIMQKYYNLQKYDEDVLKQPSFHTIQGLENNKGKSELEAYNYAKSLSKEEREKIINDFNSLENKDTLYKYYKREREEQEVAEENQILTDYSDKHPILGSIASVGYNTFGSIEDTVKYAGAGIDKAFGGDGYINPDSTNVAKAQVIREKVSEDMDGLGKFFYNTGMSIGDNIARMPLLALPGGKAMSLALAGTSAGVSSANDVINSGGSIESALLTGAAAGTAEVVFEKIPLDNLIKLKNEGTDSVFRAVVNQMKTEGLEEVGTDIANAITDQIINGDMSQLALQYQNYIAQGYSEEEARKQIAVDFASQLGQSFAAGAISGGVLSGGTVAINKIGGTIEGKSEKRKSASQLGREALQSEDFNVKELIKSAKKSDNPKAVNLANSLEKVVEEKGADKVKAVDVGNLLTLTNSKEITYDYSEDLSELTGTDKQDIIDSNFELNGEEKTTKTSDRKVKYTDTKAFGENYPHGLGAKIVKTGERINIVGLKSSSRDFNSDDNTVVLLSDNGELYDSDDIRTSVPYYNDLFDYAKNFDTIGARVYLSQYEDYAKRSKSRGKTADVAEYSENFERLYSYGVKGVTYDSIKKSGNFTREINILSAGVAYSAVQSGNNDFKVDTRDKSNKHQKIRMPGESNSINSKVYVDPGSEGSVKVTDEQLAVLQAVANKTGREIILTDRMGERTEDENANGGYNLSDGKIYINAEVHDSYMLSVSLHEAVHGVAADNPAEYHALCTFITNYLVAKGENLDDHLRIIKTNWGNRAATDESALEELVCQTVMAIATDEAAIKTALSLEENMGILKKVASALKKIAKAAYDFIKGVGIQAHNKQAQPWIDNIEALNELAVRLEKAFESTRKLNEQRANATANTETAQKNNTADNGDVKYSIVDDVVDDNGKHHSEIVLLDTKLFKGTPPRYWGKIIIDFVYNNLLGKQVEVLDENGNKVTVEFAKKNDRVTKSGANNSHKVVDKLARKTDNISRLAVAHAVELIEVSEYENSKDLHSHQWLDENGWGFRYAEIMDNKGNIYSACLNIAKTKDGRNILYDINKISNIGHGDVPSNAKSKRGSHINPNVAKNNLSQNNDNVKIKYSYGGPTAKTVNNSLFVQAIEMENSGKNSEDIRQKTGWFRGMDGKWRFEIDDSKMRFYKATKQDINNIEEYKNNKIRYNGLSHKISNNTATAEQQQKFKAAEKYIKEYETSKKLSDFVYHPELFKLYPQLKEVNFYFDTISAKGAFYPDSNAIVINPTLSQDEQRESVIHEIQHAIQHIEGFADGSTMAQWQKNGADSLTAYNNYRNTAGEIEARDTASRINLNSEQRKNTRPNIDRKDVVFAENAKISMDDIKNYELDTYSEREIKNWNSNKNIVIYRNNEQLIRFIDNALNNPTEFKKLYFGKISKNLARFIKKETNIDLTGYNLSLRSYEIRKTLINSHGNEEKENLRGQRAITKEDLIHLPEIITHPDKIELSEKLYENKPVIIFSKTINGKISTATYVSSKHHDLSLQTMYSGKNKESLATTPSGNHSFSQTSETLSGTAFNKSLLQNNNNVKRSVNDVIDENRDLVAVHNLSAKKLAKMISDFDGQGIPAPSIAIDKADNVHNDFGKISLIFDRNTIDPKADRRNSVYSRDAWTSMYPKTEFKLNEKAMKKLAERIDMSVNELETNMFDTSDIQKIKYRFEDDIKVRKAFLKENNIKATPVLRDRQPDIMMFSARAVKKFVRNNDCTFDRLVNDKEFRNELFKAYSDGASLKGIANAHIKETDEILDSAKSEEFYSVLKEIFDYAIEYAKGNVQQTEGSMTEAVNNAIEEYKEEFDRYIDELLSSGVLGEEYIVHDDVDPYDDYGNRKPFSKTHYKYNIENVVKAMKSGRSKVGSSFTGGISYVKSIGAKKLNSIDEIKGNKNRIVPMTEEEIEAENERISDLIKPLIEEVADSGSYNNDFITASNNIVDAFNSKTDVNGVYNYLKQYHNKIKMSTVKKLFAAKAEIENLPTRYFEAKPHRAVGFDEVKAAVIPADTHEALKGALKELGVPMYDYDSNNENNRAEVTQKAINTEYVDKNGEKRSDLRFSKDDTIDNEYLEAVKNNDLETAQKLVDEAAKENGYTIKAYHGTLTQGIHEFKKEYIGSRYSFDEVGFFFTDRKSIAEDYASSEFDSTKKGDVIPAYLNIRNPLYFDKSYAIKNGYGNVFRENDSIGVWDAYQGAILDEVSEKSRCDGVIIDDGTSKMLVVFEPNQIKSADPITYDDNGNVIPLSERFKNEKVDIRYSKDDTIVDYSDLTALDDEEIKVYNKRGWANQLFTNEDRKLLEGEFAKLKPVKTQRMDNVLGDSSRIVEVNNKIVLIGGTFAEPEIYCVFAINAANETEATDLKEVVFYEYKNYRRNKEALQSLFQYVQSCEEDVRTYRTEDFYYTKGQKDYGERAVLPSNFKNYGYTEQFQDGTGSNPKAGRDVSEIKLAVDDTIIDYLAEEYGKPKSQADFLKILEENPNAAILMMYRNSIETAQKGLYLSESIKLPEESYRKIARKVLIDMGVKVNNYGSAVGRLAESIKHIVEKTEEVAKARVVSGPGYFRNLFENFAKACSDYVKLSSRYNENYRKNVRDYVNGLISNNVLVVRDDDIELIKKNYGSVTEFRSRMNGKTKVGMAKNGRTGYYIEDVADWVYKKYPKLVKATRDKDGVWHWPDKDGGFRWFDLLVNDHLQPKLDTRVESSTVKGYYEDRQSAGFESALNAINCVLREKVKVGVNEKRIERSLVKELDNEAEQSTNELKELKWAKYRIEELRKRNRKLNAELNKGMSAIREEYYEARMKTVERNKLIRKLNKFIKLFENGKSSKNYVPDVLQKPILDVLKMIEMNAGTYKNGKQKATPKSFDRYTQKVSDINRAVTELTEKYETLKEKQVSYNSDVEFSLFDINTLGFEEETLEKLKTLQEQVKGKNVYELSAEDLRTIYDTINELDGALKRAVEVIIDGQKTTVQEAALQAIEEIGGLKVKKGGSGIKGTIQMVSNQAEISSLDSERFSRYISGYHDDYVIRKIINELHNGEKKVQRIKQAGYIKVTSVLSKYSNKEVKHLQKGDVVEFDFTDIDTNKRVKVSPSMLMGIYLTVKQEDGLRHIINEDPNRYLSLPDLDLLNKNNPISDLRQDNRRAVESERHRVRLSEDDISHINNYIETNAMLKELCNAIMVVFNEQIATEINNVSLQTQGRKIAVVKNYYPLSVDPDCPKCKTDWEFTSVFKDQRIKNKGFTKNRTYSILPLRIDDAMSVFSKHISETAEYCGLLVPLTNFMKIYRNGSDTDTVKSIIKKTYGEPAIHYINKFIGDLQKSDNTDNNLFLKWQGKYMGAKLLANPSAMIQQFSAFPLANKYFGTKNVAAAATLGFNKIDFDLYAKYTTYLWYRAQGNGTILGEVSKEVGFHKKLTDYLDIMGKVDRLVVGRLLYAAELHVEQTTDLKRGTDAFYKEVVRQFEKCVDETQPNNMVTSKPQFIRNNVMRALSFSAFRSQVMAVGNCIIDSFGEYNARRAEYNEIKTEEAKAAKKEAAKNFLKVLIGAAISFVLGGILKCIADIILRHKYDDIKDEKGNITFANIAWKFADESLENLASSFIWGDKLYEIGATMIDHNRYFGLEVMSVETVNDGVEKAKKGDWFAIAALLIDGFGYPAENMLRYGRSIIAYINDISNGYGEIITKNNSTENNTSYFNFIIVEAKQKGEAEKAEHFEQLWKDDLINKQGKTEEQANDTIKTKLVTALAVSDNDVEQAALAKANGDLSSYEEHMNKVVGYGFDSVDVKKAVDKVIKNIADEVKNRGLEEKSDIIADLKNQGFNDKGAEYVYKSIDSGESSESEEEMSAFSDTSEGEGVAYTYSDAFEFLKNGDRENYERIEQYLIDNADKTKKDVQSAMRSASRTDELWKEYFEAQGTLSGGGDPVKLEELKKTLTNIYGSWSTAAAYGRKYKERMKKKEREKNK